MAPLPQSNARLISIHRGGWTEDYNREAGNDPVVWRGDSDAYIQDRVVSNFSQQGELRRIKQTTLFISGDLGVTLEPGDTVVYKTSSAKRAGTVQTYVTPADLPEMPDYYKVALEDANVP